MVSRVSDQGIHRWASGKRLLALPVVATACALLQACQTQAGVTLELQQPALVAVGNEAPRRVRPGQQLVSKGQPVRIEAQDYKSLMIVPVPSQPSVVRISLKPTETSLVRASDDALDKALSDILPAVDEITRLLADGQAQRALTMANDLQRRYPDASYLDFVTASCQLVTGDQASARRLLQRGLAHFPKNSEARELLRSLESTPPAAADTGTQGNAPAPGNEKPPKDEHKSAGDAK